jgi:hypothetical protein
VHQLKNNGFEFGKDVDQFWDQIWNIV